MPTDSAEGRGAADPESAVKARRKKPASSAGTDCYFFFRGRKLREGRLRDLRRSEICLRSGSAPCHTGWILLVLITALKLRISAVVNKVRATPFRPILAVLPVRWV